MYDIKKFTRQSTNTYQITKTQIKALRISLKGNKISTKLKMLKMYKEDLEAQ